MSGQTEDITPNKDGGVLKEVKREGEANSKPWKGDRYFAPVMTCGIVAIN